MFYSSQARVDEERGSEKESIGMELRIKTSFFHRIKELVFSERMGVLILNIDGYSFDGLYSPHGYFGPFNRDKVMILDDLDMVENKEELPDFIWNKFDRPIFNRLKWKTDKREYR